MARRALRAIIGSTATEELSVYRKIIVGWDGTEQARDALALATRLRAPDGTVVAACVYPDPGGRARAGDRGIIDAAAETAAEARRNTQEDWLSTRAVPGHSPAHGLHVLIEHEGADLVVVGSSHRGELRQVMAGGVALNCTANGALIRYRIVETFAPAPFATACCSSMSIDR